MIVTMFRSLTSAVDSALDSEDDEHRLGGRLLDR